MPIIPGRDIEGSYAAEARAREADRAREARMPNCKHEWSEWAMNMNQNDERRCYLCHARQYD